VIAFHSVYKKITTYIGRL